MADNPIYVHRNTYTYTFIFTHIHTSGQMKILKQKMPKRINKYSNKSGKRKKKKKKKK